MSTVNFKKVQFMLYLLIGLLQVRGQLHIYF